MLSEPAETLPGIGVGTKLKDSKDVKKGPLFQDEDPLLAENATLPTGVFAVHVFGAQNLYLDATFPPEHYGIYVQITAGSTTKCTSLQSPFKKGRVVWDEIRNFPVTISPKVSSAANEVVITVLCFDKLQPIPKHKLLGKMEFHLHKLAKKQWSMETFELQNRKKQYAGDLQLELAFAYGSYGYGLCDQLEGHHPPRYYLQQSAFPHMELPTSSAGSSSGIMFVPKRVPHPNIIAFTEKVTNLEPEISPYFSKTNFVPAVDIKSRPLLQQKLTRLDQLHSDYSLLTSRSKRIHFLKRLLQEKDVHRSMAGEHDSDSEGSSVENLVDVTQFGLTELIQDAERHMAYGALTSGPNRSVTNNVQRKGVVTETSGVRGLQRQVVQVSGSTDSEGSAAEPSQGQETSTQVEADELDQETIEDEAEILTVVAARGRRSAVVVPSSSQKRNPSLPDRRTQP